MRNQKYCIVILNAFDTLRNKLLAEDKYTDAVE